jgi:hypothetical protein
VAGLLQDLRGSAIVGLDRLSPPFGNAAACRTAYELQQQVTRTLIDAAERQPPLVLCLDDVHWADPDSAGGLACPRQGGVEPVGHESLGRAALLDHRRLRAMGDDEHRVVVERRRVTPRLLAEVEHAPPNHDGARAR